MPRPFDRALLTAFIAEAKGYFPAILRHLDAMEQNSQDLASLEEVHRLVHTIKGASAIVGLTALSHVTYLLEESLEEIRSAQFQVTPEFLAAGRHAVGQIEAYLDDLLAGGKNERKILSDVARVLRRLRGLQESGDAAALERLLGPEPGTRSSSSTRRAVESPPPAVPSPLPEDEAAVSPELLEAFRAEALDHAQNYVRLLQQLQREPASREPLREMRQIVHTLKGAASMVGFGGCGKLAHRMEDLFERLSDDPGPLPKETFELLFESGDLLEDIFNAEAGEQAFEEPLQALRTRYEAALGGTPREDRDASSALRPLGDERIIDVEALPGTSTENVASAPGSEPSKSTASVRVPLERLDDLVKLVSELVINRSTFEQHFRSYTKDVGEFSQSVDRLKRLAARLEREYEVVTMRGGRVAVETGTAKGAASPRFQGFDELEMDRYTEFHLLSRELTETTSDLSAMSTGFRDAIRNFDADLTRLGRLTGETQDKMMRVRMVPLSTLATRLNRSVRVTAGPLGKEVDLEISGGDVALDKTVLEELADPFIHLLRNAVHHGIEPPSLRRVLDKPERGHIEIAASYEGTQVVIRVRDDGAGLDPEILRSSAVRCGFVNEEDAPQLTLQELHSLIFLPGFTTAGEISEFSGRGVGMDVVRTRVTQMKGSLSVESTPGLGTTFTIRLPLTLAILRVLLVSSNGETFAMPLSYVSQILRVERTELASLGDAPVLDVEGKVYPVIKLGEVLRLSQPADESARRVPALILNLGDRRVALVVDRLLEAQDAVVKTLGSHLRKAQGITGATLLGDGSVVLILDPREFVSGEAPTLAAEPRSRIRITARQSLTVLIVDDSLSVRQVLTNFVKSAGWIPETARDGLEAIDVLQRMHAPPDVILLDIEMPRMDGYDFMSALREEETYRKVPIIILTSRAGEKHRRKALDLGAAAYFGKPYQDEELLGTIRRLTRKAPEPAAS
jgi:chemosensory pili system protein ChpA (sensor histidine kinase/response regulator)